MDTHPNSVHARCIIGSVCFLSSSVTDVLLPLQTKNMSLAVRQQRCQRQLAFLDPSPVQEYLPVLTGRGLCWALHLLPPGQKNVHCGRIPPRFLEVYYGEIWHRPLLQVVTWWPKGSRELPGHSAHWDPYEMSNPSHHFTAVWSSSGSRWKPSPMEGGTESHDAASIAEMEHSRALSASEDFSISCWN